MGMSLTGDQEFRYILPCYDTMLCVNWYKVCDSTQFTAHPDQLQLHQSLMTFRQVQLGTQLCDFIGSATARSLLQCRVAFG